MRKKAQTLVALIKDKDRIREVRNKAAANRDKYALKQSIAFYLLSIRLYFLVGYLSLPNHLKRIYMYSQMMTRQLPLGLFF